MLFNSPCFRFLKRPLGWVLHALGFIFVLPSFLAAQDKTYQETVVPFLKAHCYSCHGPAKQESRLRLDDVARMKAENRNLWTMVHERLASGEMPPPERPQPKQEGTEKVLAWIRDQQKNLGLSGSRRLNRRELSAALKNVTGLALDFAQALPGDGTVGGFDTGAEGLLEASDAVAVWLQVTRRAVEGIRFLEPAKGKTYEFKLRETKDIRKAFDAWKGEGLTARGYNAAHTRPGKGLLLEPRAVGDRDTLNIVVPATPGRESVLRLTLTVSAMKPMEGLPNPRLWVTIGGKDIDVFEVTSAETPHRLVYDVQLGDVIVQSKGVSIHLSNKVEVPYAVKGFENEDKSNAKDPPPGGTGLFRPLFDRRALPPEKQPAPYILLHSVQLETDVVLPWPPPVWKLDVGEIKDDVESARRLLDVWADRAWRRPVTEKEKAPFLKLYQRLRDEKMSFDASLRAAFQSVLMAAPFRYQASPGHPDPVVAQHAIASRLSFMLTGGPPDAELRRLANEGKLREPAVLDAQVDRLFADPRSEGFLKPFISQWLELDQPITIAQDHIQKQDFRFARYLKASMREETLAYISSLFIENRPAREFIVSDWTMMNDALALHYGYPGIEGGLLRKVRLRPDDPRGGGILGHAGIQSMLCWMGDNWVIYRGAWTLRHILDHPPPPPPLEIPELNPSEGKNKGKPFRELLKQHQEDARCAVCHKNIDPVGFAFQNFDISGRWRDVEHESYARGELDGRIAWKGVGKTRPVDSVGHLPRRETFKTFAEFKDILVKDYQEDLVRGLLKNLVIYGTGRMPGVDDRMEIRETMKSHKAGSYPLRDLVKAVVRSRAFLERHEAASGGR